MHRAAPLAAVGAGVLVALVGCGRAASPAPSVTSAAGACALVPAAALAAVAGGQPGDGVAGEGMFGDGGCTWRAAAGTVALSVTDAPDADLLASAYPQPVSAASVPGADRGWASADRHRIVLVRGDRGVLLTVAGTARAGQADYDALAAALLGRL